MSHSGLWYLFTLFSQSSLLLITNYFLLHFRPHYNVNMTGVKVGNYSLNLSSNLYELGGKKGAIIDIGTTLAYLPEVVYEPLVIQVFICLLLQIYTTSCSFMRLHLIILQQILSRQPNLKLVTVQDQYTCFKYTERYISSLLIIYCFANGGFVYGEYQIMLMKWCQLEAFWLDGN